MKRILLLIAALFAAQPAFAREDVEVGDWTVSAFSKTCTARAIFNENKTGEESFVMLHYNAEQKYSLVDFSHSTATSLKAGDKVSLLIGMRMPEGYKEHWGKKEFEVSVLSWTRVFSSPKLTLEMIDDFARAKTISFFVGEELVAAFPLEGSAAAVTELRKCAFEVAGLNPLDPFLKVDQ